MGFELTKQLLGRDRRNTVIISGRSEDKLEGAKRALPGVQTFQSDVGDPAATVELRDSVLATSPALDTLEPGYAGVHAQSDAKSDVCI